MSASPYCPDDLAWCRSLVTQPQNLIGMEPACREDLLRLAMDVLRKDLAHRLARIEPGPRLLVMPRGPGTPGDAA